MDLQKYYESIGDSDKIVQDFFKKRSDFRNIEFLKKEDIKTSLEPITQRLDIQSKQLEEQKEFLQQPLLALPPTNTIPAIGSGETATNEDESVKKRPIIHNPDKGLNVDILREEELPLPSTLLDVSAKDLQRLRDDVTSGNKKLGRLKRGRTKEERDQIDQRVEARKKYYDRLDDIIKCIGSREETTGSGMKYTQSPRNAYKILNGKYGSIQIDEDKLKYNMILHIKINDQKMKPISVDQDTIDLLTKRFNQKKNYSVLARSVFHDLNLLANLPKHKSFGKSKLKGGAIRYYSGPKELIDRLEMLTASMKAGNNSPSLFKEIYDILNILLKTKEINQDFYNTYVNKYLLR